ncbi:MAG: phage terminase large subunit family protein [Candidatus Marinimicrobia bacterium]|nr:phage terminase large subunit family protein [Candidatus Neomarinimicrobiota bacterium]
MPLQQRAKSSGANIQSVPTLLRSEFVERVFFTDSGAPFSFRGREYLKPIYNEKRRYLVLLASRQAEKSTYIAKDLLMNAMLNDNDALLYATALLKHVDDFCRRKIDKQFNFNEALADEFLGPGTIDNVRDKLFSNGSTISLRAIGTSPESARGIPARKIYFDETQSIQSDNFPIVMESTQSYPDDSAYIFAGTPLTRGNYLSQLYYRSNQNEWIITCNKCKKENEPLGISHINENKPYLFCQHCGKKMIAANGRWIPQNPESTSPGYRICRLMTPTARWLTPAKDGILDKYLVYPEAQFMNEVLGLPWDVGVVPITAEEVYACCDDYDLLELENPPRWIPGKETFLAIDWAWSDIHGGQSYTIISVCMIEFNRIKIIYAKRFAGPKYHDPQTVLDEIALTVARFSVKAVGTDFGVGHKENLRLRPMLPRIPVFEMMYTNQKTEAHFDWGSKTYTLSRTKTLDDVFSRLAKKKYKFPRKEVIKTFAEDILNVYIEYDPNYKRVKYEHAGTGPDDFLHLLNYSAILVEMFYKERFR